MKKTMKQKHNQAWFLETSAHINRLFGHRLLKWKIKTTAAAQPCYTSFFVFYEFKRRVVKTLINLYYAVQEEESPADALSYFMQVSRSIREIKIVLGAVSTLLSRDDLRNDKRKSLAALEILINDSLQDFLDSIKDFAPNQVKCPLAKASDKSYEEFLEQIECKAKCTIAQFWKRHRRILQLLTRGDLIEPHRKNRGFSDMLPLLHEVLEDCQVGQTIRNCSKLADVIIAVEMPREHTMLTFDRSFESLCPLMGKEVKRLPSLAALKRQSLDNQKQQSL
jgi:hypothetical protein